MRMRSPLRKIKAFYLKAFLLSVKLVLKKISEQNKVLKHWDVSLSGRSGFQLVLNEVTEKVT